MNRYYHNPRCSKSRQGLALLEEADVSFEIVEYLKNAPTKKEIQNLLKKLDKDIFDVIRKKEAPLKELAPDKRPQSSSQMIEFVLKNPILLERPIFETSTSAVIGRPPEEINKLI